MTLNITKCLTGVDTFDPLLLRGMALLTNTLQPLTILNPSVLYKKPTRRQQSKKVIISRAKLMLVHTVHWEHRQWDQARPEATFVVLMRKILPSVSVQPSADGPSRFFFFTFCTTAPTILLLTPLPKISRRARADFLLFPMMSWRCWAEHLTKQSTEALFCDINNPNAEAQQIPA